MRRAMMTLLGCAIIVGIVLTLLHGSPHKGPVYTVAQVRVGLQHHPRVWLGRVLAVRGRILGCPTWASCDPSADALLALYPPEVYPSTSRDVAQGLPVMLAPMTTANRLLMILQHLPMIGLVFAPERLGQAFERGSAIYHIRIVKTRCGVTPCEISQLLDIAP